jgi:cytochrome c oxidase subunit III
MSTHHPDDPIGEGHDAHAHHGGHGHGSPFIQHHFDDAKHQFESGKLGIWLFLGQEVLFFSALFVAYIVYRHNHPEAFAYAHKYLDVKWGAINTAVLIFSSLTAAWAVRAAQLAQKKLLVTLLALTIACACAFLGIKYVEYTHKIHIGTLFGHCFRPEVSPDGTALPPSDKKCLASEEERRANAEKAKAMIAEAEAKRAAEQQAQAAAGIPAWDTRRPVEIPEGMTSTEVVRAYELGGVDWSTGPPPGTSMFFTIYFAMTGLHGIHVLAGVFVFVWLLVRAIKGHFTPEYFGPVDFAALYWHLVDLIWIFLFPLLYLIH